jgi:hypothetical protein
MTDFAERRQDPNGDNKKEVFKWQWTMRYTIACLKRGGMKRDF